MSNTKIIHNQFIGTYESVLSQENCKNIIKLFEDDLKNEVDNLGGNQFFRDKMERYDYQKFYQSSDKSNKIVSVINDVLDKCIQLYAEEFWVVKQLKATSLIIKLHAFVLLGNSPNPAST